MQKALDMGTYLTFCDIKSGYLATTIFYALDWNALCEVTLHTKSPTTKAFFSGTSANRLATRQYLSSHS